MATTVQKKVMDYLERVATDSGLDFVDNKSFSNYGTVYLQNGFKTVISFNYYFDNGNIKIDFYPEGVNTKMSWGMKDSRCILSIYSTPFELEENISKMEDLIKSHSISQK